ncbi:hypothetical protein EW145_g5247, partial [Phellinidium pouzarii]
MLALLVLSFFTAFLSRPVFIVRAANAAQWRTRSIYQTDVLTDHSIHRIIVDRYALPDTTSCDVSAQTWCNGTWNNIRANLDYVQDAGFTAIWISPVSQNYIGPRTVYGDPYHGYWIADASKLNDRFGTSDDLKALSDELHRRGMYLMVDVVVNDVMALSTNPDLSTYLFKEESQYHPYCAIDWGNTTSEQTCWLGDTNIPLADIKTEDPTVVSTYNNWVKQLVQEYNIDGLRIDAAKHVDIDFWPGFCESAGVFCIGEVFDADPSQAAQYQGKDSLDSILHYPMYNALISAFSIPGPLNMSAMTDMIAQCKSLFVDPTLLGNFLENQDVPRFGNLSVDQQSAYNAMVFNFMSDGIPIVYYGQEQGFHGASDPDNREPLFTSNFVKSTGYNLTTTLNQFRNFLVNSSDWATQQMEVLASNDVALAIRKGSVISVVTNAGSPPNNASIPVYTGYHASTILFEVLSCQQFSVGSGGAIQVEYGIGGHASIFMEQDGMQGTGLCGFSSDLSETSGKALETSSGMRRRFVPSKPSLAVTASIMSIAMTSARAPTSAVNSSPSSTLHCRANIVHTSHRLQKPSSPLLRELKSAKTSKPGSVVGGGGTSGGRAGSPVDHPVRLRAKAKMDTPSNTNVHAIVKAQIVFLLSTLTEENFEQNQLQIRSLLFRTSCRLLIINLCADFTVLYYFFFVLETHAIVIVMSQLSEQHGLNTYLHFIRRLIVHSQARLTSTAAPTAFDTSTSLTFRLLVQETQRLARDPFLADRFREGVDRGDGEIFRAFDLVRFADRVGLRPLERL